MNSDLNDLMESFEYDRMMDESARDWEIIRNRPHGTNERFWTNDSDYSKNEDNDAFSSNGSIPVDASYVLSGI